MMDATYRALIEGLTSALADDDLDLSGFPTYDLRDVLQQQRTQLGITGTGPTRLQQSTRPTPSSQARLPAAEAPQAQHGDSESDLSKSFTPFSCNASNVAIFAVTADCSSVILSDPWHYWLAGLHAPSGRRYRGALGLTEHAQPLPLFLVQTTDTGRNDTSTEVVHTLSSGSKVIARRNRKRPSQIEDVDAWRTGPRGGAMLQQPLRLLPLLRRNQRLNATLLVRNNAAKHRVPHPVRKPRN